MSIGEQANFLIDENVLEGVDPFKCLGSLVTKDCKLDGEITARFQAASCAVGRGSPQWMKISISVGLFSLCHGSQVIETRCAWILWP